MGAVVDSGSICQAKDADGKPLGKFDDRKAAVQAITTRYISARLRSTTKRPRLK
jgi:hypothetical protein